MVQANKSSFAYLKHAKQTGAPIVEDQPERAVAEETLPQKQSEPVMLRTPTQHNPSIGLEPDPEPFILRKSGTTRSREKYTTHIDVDVREAITVELAKMRRMGTKQSPADLINQLLRNWLIERGVRL